MLMRHPHNRNLKLHYGPAWEGLNVFPMKNGLVIGYLEDIRTVLDNTLYDYNRAVVIRFDLHIPEEYQEIETIVITRFINALKARIAADLERKARQGSRVYPCVPRIIWAKERAESHNQHYHVAVTLNRDTYFTLGGFKTAVEAESLWSGAADPDMRENLADRIRAAWASALRIPPLMAIGLVHFVENPVYTIDCNSDQFYWQYAQVFLRLSYLAKADTKYYGDSSRHFGSSRQ